MTTQTIDLPTFPQKPLQRTFVILEKVSFDDAAELCELQNGSLATITSIEEDEFITEELNTTLQLDAPYGLDLEKRIVFSRSAFLL